MHLHSVLWYGALCTAAGMLYRRVLSPRVATLATLLLLAVGGLVTSFIMELLVYPVIYALWKWWGEVRPRVYQVVQADLP